MLTYLIIIISVCLAVLFYKNINYWKYKNIKHIKPWTILGSFEKNTLGLSSFAKESQYLYNYHPDAKYVGLFQFTQPVLLIRDPEIIRQICVKSFDNFMNHTTILTEDIDPLFGKGLFSLRDQRWRDMRATLSPAFTSSKMRAMYTLIKECAEQFCCYFQEEAKKNSVSEVEMKDIFTRYTNDVIATSAFGITCNSLKDKENEFYLAGQEISNFASFVNVLKLIMIGIFPKISSYLKLTLFSNSIGNFFRDIIKTTKAYREENNIIRPDMVHLLMEAQKGRLKHEKQKDDDAGFATVEESNIGKEENKNKPMLTDDDITAQAMLFFLGGFDTTSTLMCFLAHELAVNVDIQKKLQDEIDVSFKKCDGDINYETLLKMKYLDMVLSECLRKWPPMAIIDRICTQDFTLTDSDTSIVIKKGQTIWLPAYSLHHDPKYFSNPEKFDPERFNDENKNNIFPFTYIPFGQGPRNCIGSRFALLQVKALFTYLLRNFDIVVIEKTQIPFKLAKTSFSMRSEKGFWLGLKLRT